LTFRRKNGILAVQFDGEDSIHTVATITDIQEQKHNAGRVSLFVDGAFLCGADRLTVAEYRLRIGDEVQEGRLTAMLAESECRSCFDRALGRLNKGMMTERDLKAYLREKNYLPEAVDYAVAKLHAYNYLSDEAYVEAYFHDHAAGTGDKGMRFALAQRGVDPKAVAAFFDARESDRPRAEALADKYMKGKARVQKEKVRLARYLYTRGFSNETARAVTASFFDGEDEC
jgi:regulatory protein